MDTSPSTLLERIVGSKITRRIALAGFVIGASVPLNAAVPPTIYGETAVRFLASAVGVSASLLIASSVAGGSLLAKLPWERRLDAVLPLIGILGILSIGLFASAMGILDVPDPAVDDAGLAIRSLIGIVLVTWASGALMLAFAALGSIISIPSERGWSRG